MGRAREGYIEGRGSSVQKINEVLDVHLKFSNFDYRLKYKGL